MSAMFRMLTEIARTIRYGSKDLSRTRRMACLIMTFAASFAGVVVGVVWLTSHLS